MTNKELMYMSHMSVVADYYDEYVGAMEIAHDLTGDELEMFAHFILMSEYQGETKCTTTN